MTRTQIQLPDDLSKRARRVAAQREISMAEMTRRGLELFLDRLPPAGTSAAPSWKIPKVHAGGLLVPLEKVREAAREEESDRGLRR